MRYHLKYKAAKHLFVGARWEVFDQDIIRISKNCNIFTITDIHQHIGMQTKMITVKFDNGIVREYGELLCNIATPILKYKSRLRLIIEEQQGE
jgi:hypothetical protein